MSTDEIIDRAIPHTRAGTRSTLPDDLLQAASRRLGTVALVWAGLWAFGLFMNNLVGPIISPDVPLDDAWPWPANPVAIAVILLSVALFGYTRKRACDCQFSLDLGLWYEVALAFAIGLVNQWTPNTVGLSWICVLVLVHPMIVPNTRPKILLAGLVAASMDPVGLAITGARGIPIPSLPQILWTYLPNYICAVLAVLPSHIITRLGRQVSHARELGSYQMGELLGRGGMGEVYSARHRMLRRPAAIKLIRPDALGAGNGERSGTIVERFKREAEAAANLHSPHTIALYDFGLTGDGNFYYVMELLQGVDLESLVVRFGPLPPARVVYLLQQVCHSLAEAHAIGLIHRDIKPGNLYSCRVGLEVDFVKVLDFGLVKAGPESAAPSAKLTAPDLTIGTPAYMAPEVAQGEALDGRADLYALGCVAYWLLTGKLVFTADTPMKMMIAHTETTPVAPSQRGELAISRSLDEVVLACLAKDRNKRPADADELSRRLAACDVGEPWTQECAAAWWGANLPEIRPSTGRRAPVSPALAVG
ncbi:MAG: protein kinase [Gemmatimonadales bacterium]|nr:protein kinase [Gemmatimonadales bacterium]NIN12519.1 protein kinase [Gemmatimonadales bacterium]NIN50890.1 protein kinase [Gemmatimonadales bacterium]NIP08354.1 protein kinase [Gemmatimonadales bacterium]NIR03451.1 protein kinase [Gemmatimonadales bacterium]